MKRTVILTGVFLCALNFAATAQPAHALSISTVFNNDAQIVGAKQSFGTVAAREEIKADEENKETSMPKDAEPAAPETPMPIEHVVQPGETLSKIAVQHQTTWKRLYDKNTHVEDPNAIQPNDKLIVPTANEQLADRELPVKIVVPKPVPVRASVEKSVVKKPQPKKSSMGSTAGNTYTRGYCTWYVKNRRPDMPNNLGNALTWVSRAAAQGMATGSTPRAGAVGQSGNHVVYVESVNGDGSITVSEMNHKGWNITSSRTVAASTFHYIY